MQFPYNDDYMIYDYVTHRYVLTLKDVEERLQIDLVSRFGNADGVPAFLREVSGHIYNYIHSMNNIFSDIKDFVIAKTPRGRAIIQRAMEEQAIYMSMVGDLHRSLDKEKRAMGIDEEAETELNQLIPEMGCSLLYTGRIYLDEKFINESGGNW